MSQAIIMLLAVVALIGVSLESTWTPLGLCAVIGFIVRFYV